MNVTLTQHKGEPRVDSLLIAEQLGHQHKNVISLVRAYPSDFAEFGRVAFETRTLPTAGGPQKYEVALLNEDQCYLLLTYSRNTPKARALKVGLVKAFREARERASVTDAKYLPFYHAMHAEVSALAQRARDCGSSTPEQMFHINANKALNAAMGIAAGERGTRHRTASHPVLSRHRRRRAGHADHGTATDPDDPAGRLSPPPA